MDEIMEEKARENRLRRLAKKHDMVIRKDRGRGEAQQRYGKGYILVDIRSGAAILGGRVGYYDMTLDDIEDYLGSEEKGE